MEQTNENKAENLAAKYYELDQQIKALMKEQEEIKAVLKDNAPGVYKLGPYVVELKERTTTSFNRKLAESFIESNGGNVLEFVSGSSSKVLSVKKVDIEVEQNGI